ncbi:hypothetical protein F4859DRAFT_478677 [Xylaria cf. heliscus]|nr:hypothetical protein F4859DRAFT_478677 [Xylaria cf. heliscus]
MPGVILEPLAGCIKWLPRKRDLIPDDPNIDEGCCNHPVVILSTRPRNGRVQILIITSFGGDDLETKYPTQRLARLDHLPIAPSKVHPDNGVLLVLRDRSDEMRKKSYVKLRNRKDILLRSLEPYNRFGPEIFLSKRSYQTLVKHTHFVELQDAPVPHESTDRRTPEILLYGQNLEQTNSIGRNNNVEDIYNHTIRQILNSHNANNYSVRPTPSITSSSATSRPLVATRQEYRPRSYGSYTPLPVTHPIRPDNESDSSGSTDVIQVFVFILLISLIVYGVYCYIVSDPPSLVLTKKTFESVAGMAKSLWASFLYI